MLGFDWSMVNKWYCMTLLVKRLIVNTMTIAFVMYIIAYTIMIKNIRKLPVFCPLICDFASNCCKIVQGLTFNI